MIDKLLSRLSFLQTSDLCDLPFTMICPDDKNEELEQWTIRFAKYLSGKITWDKLINEKLETKQDIKAFSIYVEAKQHKIDLSESVLNNIHQYWIGKRSEFQEYKNTIIVLLNKLPKEALEANNLAEIIRQEINDEEFVSKVPNSIEDIKSNLNLPERFKTFESECRDLLEIANEEIQASKEHYRDIVIKAFLKLFDKFNEGSFLSNQAERELFMLLPKFIVDRDKEVLEQIIDDNAELKNINIPNNFTRNRSSKSRIQLLRKYSKQDFINRPSPSFILNDISNTFFNAVNPSEKILSCFEDFEQIKGNLEGLLNYEEQAQEWLGIAKICKEKKLQMAALGEGLLKQALILLDSERDDIARKLLIDSFRCFVESKFEQSMISIERATKTILCSWIWPRLTATNISRRNRSKWINSPEFIIDHLRDGKNLKMAGRIWAGEFKDDEQAEKFIDIVGMLIGNERTLFRHCAEQIMTPSKLIMETDYVIHRLKWLLHDADPPKTLFNLFDQISREIVSGKISFSGKKRILDLANEIKIQLNNLSQDTVAPVREILEMLPVQLEKIVKRDQSKQLSAPKLTVQKMVKCLFPDERSQDIEFPLIVRNAENATPAPDVRIILRYAGKEDNPIIQIEKSIEDVGHLDPGQYCEVVFFINYMGELINEVTEALFRVEIRMGMNVEYSEITVKIQPSPKKHRFSPYVHGAAVSGKKFVGREKEIKRLLGCLLGEAEQKAAIVYGIRRIGKTSILKQIEINPNVISNYYIIFWDVEDRNHNDTSVLFLLDLCTKILNSIPNEYQDIISFDTNRLQERPYDEFEKFIESIDKAKLPKKFLIIIDEFDKLIQNARKSIDQNSQLNLFLGPKDSFQEEAFGALRKVLMTSDNFRYIVAGMPLIVKQEYQHRLFGLMDPIEVRMFTETEAKEIVSAGEDIMPLSVAAREMIFEASGLQPYLLQIICNELFHRMLHSGRDLVSEFDVKTVIEEKILPNEEYFLDYVSLIGDAWKILYGLARAQRSLKSGYKERWASVNDVAQELAHYGIEYDSSEIYDVLTSLRVDSSGVIERPLVLKSNKKFKLLIGLIGDHLIRKGIDY